MAAHNFLILSTLIVFPGSSGDESDSSRGVPTNNYNIDVPVGLQVIPLCPNQETNQNSNGSEGFGDSERVSFNSSLSLRINFNWFNYFPQIRSAEQFVAEMACLQVPPPGLIIRNGSVYTRTKIAKGTRYGPYIGRFSDGPPQNEQYGWEVGGYVYYSIFFVWINTMTRSWLNKKIGKLTVNH